MPAELVSDTGAPATAKVGRIPMMPVLHGASLRIGAKAQLPSLLDSGSQALTTSGRAALALALRQMGIKAGDEVLIPAYHCIAMVGPVRAAGASPVFFPVQPDLSVDMNELNARITSRTRALVMVHYFGFLQSLGEMRQLCDRRGIALIEDCAHAYYGSIGGVAVGRSGDFALGSLMKFFPTFDGGCLVSYRHELKYKPTQSRGAAFQLKAGLNIAERSGPYATSSIHKFAVAALTRSRSLVVRAVTATGDDPKQHTLGAAEGGFDFEDAWVDTRISVPSSLIWKYANHQRSVARRRQACVKLLDALRDVPGAKPLYETLPEGMAPFALPVVLKNPEATFEALWAAGIPMYRWEQVAGDVCPVSREYQTSLVQLPCHQELSDAQIDWLCGRAREVLTRRLA